MGKVSITLNGSEVKNIYPLVTIAVSALACGDEVVIFVLPAGLPVFFKGKIAELNAGDLLEVTCTDPGALNDIPAWCRINGHLVKEMYENDDEVVVVIEVNS